LATIGHTGPDLEILVDKEGRPFPALQGISGKQLLYNYLQEILKTLVTRAGDLSTGLEEAESAIFRPAECE
jgi:hypothetical protein